MDIIKSIKVLGSGCPTCHKLYELTQQAARELNLNIAVEYSTDTQEIINLGLMSSPVLVVDNQPVLIGQLPKLDKIKEILAVAAGQI
jgi:small redox-active disulfide protein 2